MVFEIVESYMQTFLEFEQQFEQQFDNWTSDGSTFWGVGRGGCDL